MESHDVLWSAIESSGILWNSVELSVDLESSIKPDRISSGLKSFHPIAAFQGALVSAVGSTRLCHIYLSVTTEGPCMAEKAEHGDEAAAPAAEEEARICLHGSALLNYSIFIFTGCRLCRRAPDINYSK